MTNPSDSYDHTNMSSVCDWMSSSFPLLAVGDGLFGHYRGLHLACMHFDNDIISLKSEDINTTTKKASFSKSLWILFILTCTSSSSSSWRTVYVEDCPDGGLEKCLLKSGGDCDRQGSRGPITGPQHFGGKKLHVCRVTLKVRPIQGGKKTSHPILGFYVHM